MILEQLNKLLETNSIMVRCYEKWYRLESISMTDDGKVPIIVSNEDAEELYHFDMADIKEFDPSFKEFEQMDTGVVGYA